MPEAGRISEPHGRLNDQPPDGALAALAARQHAVFGLDQLAELGLTPRTVQKRAATGRLHRIHQGVYSLVPPKLLTRDGLWMAAVLACGPSAVLSHRSAAALLELRAWGHTEIEVTVPGRAPRKRAGIAVHRSTTLRPRDTTRVRKIPCTTVSRTQLDIAEVLDRRGVERALDQAEILEVLDARALHEQLSHNPTRPGTPRIRAVLEDYHAGSTVSWSELEERFLALIRAAQLPEPELNAWIVMPDRAPAICADFVWWAQRLVVETDGHATHRTREAFERDRRRDQRLATAGWRPIRVTWRQIINQRDEVVATLSALLKL